MLLSSLPTALLPRPPPDSRARRSRAFSVRAPPSALVRPQPRAARANLTRPAAFALLSPRAVGCWMQLWSPPRARDASLACLRSGGAFRSDAFGQTLFDA